MNIRNPFKRKQIKSKPVKPGKMKLSNDGKKLLIMEAEPEPEIEFTIQSISSISNRRRLYNLGYI